MNQLTVCINHQIEAVNNWMIVNNLILNLNKSNITLIKSYKKTIGKIYLINLILLLQSYLP